MLLPLLLALLLLLLPLASPLLFAGCVELEVGGCVGGGVLRWALLSGAFWRVAVSDSVTLGDEPAAVVVTETKLGYGKAPGWGEYCNTGLGW